MDTGFQPKNDLEMCSNLDFSVDVLISHAMNANQKSQMKNNKQSDRSLRAFLKHGIHRIPKYKLKEILDQLVAGDQLWISRDGSGFLGMLNCIAWINPYAHVVVYVGVLEYVKKGWFGRRSDPKKSSLCCSCN